MLVVLFSAAAIYESKHLSAFTRPEVWVHLRTGSWILENRAIPHTGLFSQYSNLAWNDSAGLSIYCWELLTSFSVCARFRCC